MSKVTVLGGAGVVGSTIVRTLAKLPDFTQIILADVNFQKAKEIVTEIGSDRVEAAEFDATDKESIKRVIKDAKLVVNAVGPFFMFVKPIFDTVLEEKIDYLDICDDVDVTLELLDRDKEVADKGITALLGMGSSPGVTNILGKFASEALLEETDAIDIYHVHGGEPEEGAGVIEHRFHAMEIEIPMYLDNELKYVKFFEEGGINLRERTDFFKAGDDIPVYPYPHPEQVTMPKFIKTKQVTNKGMVMPEKYYNMIKDLVGLGLNSREPVTVSEQSVMPREFAISYILSKRAEILEEEGYTTPKGCVKVEVSGKKHGKKRKYVFSMASTSEGLGEGTGIPAAMAAILMSRGKITRKGIFPPEAGVLPMDFIGLMAEIMSLESDKKSGAFDGLLIEEEDENGIKKKIDLF